MSERTPPLLNATQVQSLLMLATAAGNAILTHHPNQLAVRAKADDSPVTQADEDAHRILNQGLQGLFPDWPVVSEEGDAQQWLRQSQAEHYWLIDPLDGTRGFLDGSGQFAVNVALIHQAKPVFGLIHAPHLARTWWAQQGQGCFVLDDEGQSTQLHKPTSPQTPIRVAISRHHHKPETLKLIAHLGDFEAAPCGASLKFGRMVEGELDVYPRAGETGYWDIAAGQCLVETLGGHVLGLDGQPLSYPPSDTMLNPHFYAHMHDEHAPQTS